VKKVFSILFACVLVLSLVGFGLPAFADPGDDGGTPYPGYTGDPYTRDPTELMTQEYFGNEWVNTIPDDPSVTSPWEHHGYIAGSPLQLTPYEGPGGAYDYFATLASDSPRVAMLNIGKSTMGKDMFIVAVSSTDTIKRLDKYKENLQKLADPRKLGYPEDEAAANEAAANLIADASKLKPIYWILCAVHASEVGSIEMSMELAYRLAVDKRSMFNEIRDNLIVFITFPNPDGVEMVSNWVNYYMQDPEWKDDEPSAPYYNWYEQHDNNRDTHTNAMPERLNVVQAYNQYPAQVMLDIHQSIFLSYTFSGRPPTHPSFDPITQTEWHWYAALEIGQMQQFGMPGVSCHYYVNMWHPTGQMQMCALRSGTNKFYEIYGRSYPTTFTRTNTTQGWEWYRPMPYALPELVWSLRNNVNYSQTLALTTALTMAQNRELVLRNYWAKTKNAISNAGKTAVGSVGPFTYPYAYVIPAVQKDMPDTVRMINNLLGNGVEIHTADSAFSFGGEDYPAGSFIISLRQPTSRVVYALLSTQFYPVDEAMPSDTSAFQYHLMRDIDRDSIDDPDIYDVPMTLITADQIECPYTVSGEISTGYYVIDHNSINNIVTLVFGLDGYDVYAAEGSEDVVDVGDVLILADQAGVYEALESLVPELGLTMHSVAEVTVDMHELNAPRVALFHSWRCIQDGGWQRWVLEQYDVPHDVIQRTDVLAGNLIDDYDVIFLPDTSGSRIKSGDSPGSKPEEVWYGPVQTTERTGGLGDAGIAELKAFVDAGGLLICNNASTDLPINYDFIEDVDILLARSDPYFNAPGPIVRILPNPDNPIAYGADEEECIYQNRSPVFDAPEDWVVAYYPEDPDDVLLSGRLEGADVIAGKAAIVDAPAKDGDGHVVLFGTDITYRGRAFGAFFYLWNAMLNWDD